MKNILTTLLIALTLSVALSSCKKDEDPKVQVGASMFGTYTGNVTKDLRINFGTVVNIDTTFLAPGVAATGILSKTAYDDSLSLQVQMNVNGTPIDITVLGHIDSENAFTVPTTIYNYLGAVAIRVNASGTVSGNNAKVNVKLAEPDGSTNLIFGDLDFDGNK